MKKLFSILIMVGIVMGAVAQDAEYTLLRHSFRHNADGSIDVQYRKELKLLRSRAYTAYTTQDGQGESFIQYNPSFMQLTINESYTLLPDGRKVENPKNAFVEQLPSYCKNCGPYNGLREMVVVHTALEVGATIVLDYTLHINSKNGYFCKSVNYNENYPIQRLEINGFDGKDTILTNVAANSYEPYKYTDLTHHYNAEYGNPPIWAVEKSVPEATELLKKLKRETLMETAEAIRLWILESINTNDILDNNLIDNQPLPAAVVYANGCGSTNDKTGLLCALLNQSGIEAQWKMVNGKTVPMLIVKLDGIDYNMIAHESFTPQPISAAHNKAGYNESKIDKIIEWKPQTLADGFAQLKLPSEYQTARSRLMKYVYTTSRRSDMCITTCDNNFHYTLELPKGARLMGGDVDLRQQVEGIGEVSVNITQKKRNVEMTIHIQVLASSISPEKYEEFRKMVSLLTGVEYLLFEL